MQMIDMRGRRPHMIMVAEVAAATSGSTPISSISGPFTMPPPTPNMPTDINHPVVTPCRPQQCFRHADVVHEIDDGGAA